MVKKFKNCLADIMQALTWHYLPYKLQVKYTFFYFDLRD